MDKQPIANLSAFNPNDKCEARKLIKWTLGHCITMANHQACLCKEWFLLTFVSVCYPPTQAYHAQYLSINITQLNFMDTIMDSVKSSIQLV